MAQVTRRPKPKKTNRTANTSIDDFDPDPALYFPAGANGVGFLIIPIEGSPPLIIKLTPSLCQVVMVLHHAMQAEAAWLLELRGWRSAEDLIKALEDINHYEVQEPTLRKYLSDIRMTIKKEIARLPKSIVPDYLKRVPFIELKRKQGARLSTDRLKPIMGPDELAGGRA